MEGMRDVRPIHGEQPLLNHSLPSVVPPFRAADRSEQPARTMDAIAERIFGRRRTMRRGEVARHAGVPLRVARRLWRSLGFQNVRAEDTVFSNADLEALTVARRLLERHEIDEDVLIGLTRGIGTTTERLATWQAEVIAERLQSLEGARSRRTREEGEEAAITAVTGGSEGIAERVTPEVASSTGLVLADLADDLEQLIGYAWRRHLTASLSTLFADATSEELAAGVTRTVGFADMVSFSERVAHSNEGEIARLVTRFEELTVDVVARYRGRVVKTIGDEVLYQALDPRSAVLIAHDLVRSANQDPMLPPLRVGVSTGRVLLRLGDVYGDTVNRAARLTTSAAAGTVLTDPATAGALSEDPAWRFAELPQRSLHGIGPVTPYHLLSVPPGASVRDHPTLGERDE
ncbi:adenylate/guanylate cyclase domain-containing protein [Kytococcus sp. Marseille-QA3725]